MAVEHSGEAEGEGQGMALKSTRHDHNLLKFEDRGSYTCKGCGEIGIYYGYRCSESCKEFILHEQCATLEDEKQYPIWNHVKFKFLSKTWFPHQRCTACGHLLKGFLYESEKQDIRLHPLCLELLHKFEYKGKKFELKRMIGEPYQCCYCRKRIETGWKYVSGKNSMDITCAKYYIHGLIDNAIEPPPMRRLRDRVKPILKCGLRILPCVADAMGLVDTVQGLVDG